MDKDRRRSYACAKEQSTIVDTTKPQRKQRVV